MLPVRLAVLCWLGVFFFVFFGGSGASAEDSAQMRERLLGKLRTELTAGNFSRRQEHADTRIDTALEPAECNVLKSPHTPDTIFLVLIGKQVCACVFDGREVLRRIYTFPGNRGFRVESDGVSDGTIVFIVTDESEAGLAYRLKVSLRYQDGGYEMVRELAPEK